jgi:hypothetical protein
MHQEKRLAIIATAFAWAMPAFADSITFHPEHCDFEASFPATPTITQSKAETSRGDAVVTDKASLGATLDGKPAYLRAECTFIRGMGFVDEDVLKNVMRDLGETYKLQNAVITVEHNAVAGPVGKLRGRGRVGGKDMVIEIRRYTSKTEIFDLWIGAEPDAFPTAADMAFLQSLRMNGQDVR